MHDDLDSLGLDNIRAVLCGDIRTRERPNAEIKWHASPTAAKTERILTGYASIFNVLTTLYEGKQYVVKERIDPHFFDDVLGDPVHLNVSHEPSSAMARTGVVGPGALELSVDAHGLRVYARLPLDDPDVQRIAPKLDRGIFRDMSFAFRTLEEDVQRSTDEQGREVETYTLLKCARLFDVTVCPAGQYPETEVALRAVYAAQIAAPTPGRASAPAAARERHEIPAPAPRDMRSLLLAQGTLALMTIQGKRNQNVY